MPIQKITSLLDLVPNPLEAALLEIIKPFPIWIGRYDMEIKDRGRSNVYQLFEPDQALITDELVVDGERFVYILRNGNKWPARLLADASRSDAIDHFAPGLREGVSRVRPVQNGISNGYLKISSVHIGKQVPKHTNGPQLTITSDESAYWLSQCDLIKSSEHAPEWRFRQSVFELRMVGMPESS